MILNENASFAMEILKVAINRTSEEKLYNRWIAGGYDKEITFREFKNELQKSQNIEMSEKKTDEILGWIFSEMG